MMNSIGRVLSDKTDVLRLTFYVAPVSLAVLLPFYLAMEAEGLAQYQGGVRSRAYLGEEEGLGCKVG